MVDAFLVAYFAYAYPVHQLFRQHWLELCIAVLIVAPIMGLLAHLYALLSDSEENTRAKTGERFLQLFNKLFSLQATLCTICGWAAR